jgi:hypothetical protein
MIDLECPQSAGVFTRPREQHRASAVHGGRISADATDAATPSAPGARFVFERPAAAPVLTLVAS